jgi:alkylated DNA nucleotide flippase Atl1
MLDEDLADLYGVETKRLVQQVRRNLERFPEDLRQGWLRCLRTRSRPAAVQLALLRRQRDLLELDLRHR